MTMPLQMTTASTIRFIDKNGAMHYYMRDYQGNNILILSAEGLVEDSITYYPYGEPILRPTFGGATSGAGSLMAANRYLFADKEYSTLAGQKEHNFGARPLPAAIPQWSSPDRFAEKYYPFSTYTYCAANPVKYCDPSGKKLSNAANEVLKQIIDVLTNYLIKNKNTEENLKINQFIKDSSNLIRSEQEFDVKFKEDDGIAYSSFDSKSGIFIFNIPEPNNMGNLGLAAHEFNHGIQFLKVESNVSAPFPDEIGTVLKGAVAIPILLDMNDEYECYDIQNLFILNRISKTEIQNKQIYKLQNLPLNSVNISTHPNIKSIITADGIDNKDNLFQKLSNRIRQAFVIQGKTYYPHR